MKNLISLFAEIYFFQFCGLPFLSHESDPYALLLLLLIEPQLAQSRESDPYALLLLLLVEPQLAIKYRVVRYKHIGVFSGKCKTSTDDRGHFAIQLNNLYFLYMERNNSYVNM